MFVSNMGRQTSFPQRVCLECYGYLFAFRSHYFHHRKEALESAVILHSNYHDATFNSTAAMAGGLCDADGIKKQIA